MSGYEIVFSFLREIVLLVIEPDGHSIAVLYLAGVFVWSGTVKLRQPMLAALAIVDFRVVRQVRSYLGTALGAGETLVALVLIVGVLPQLTLGFAAALLWAFTFLITRSLLAGERFACFCFGDSDSKLSNFTLLRTLALALLASLLAITSPPALVRTGFGLSALFLQAIAASSLLGSTTLITYIPRLIRWTLEPVIVPGSSRT